MVFEGMVCFDYNCDFGCCFCEFILLFKKWNVFYVFLEDVEYIIIYSK